MRTKLTILLFLLLSVAVPVNSQSIREQVLMPKSHSAGSSMAYEYTPQRYTAPPKGYSPFYISHLGRHGSRYHTSDKMFKSLASLFERAAENGDLTPKGEELKQKIDKIFAEMNHRWGDLTQVGVDEHRGIAERMYSNFTPVFASQNGECRIVAKSTLVPRCILSMCAFSERLKELDPKMNVSRESSDKNNFYMNHYSTEYREYYENGAWREAYAQFIKENVNPDRLISSLFKSGKPSGLGDHNGFMTNLFSAASILQGTPIKVSLYDIFTDDEIFALWKVQNLNQYLRKGPSALGGDLALSIAKPMLKDFLSKAEVAIKKGNIAADLRFAHGENIMPFTALIGIEEACVREPNLNNVYMVWHDFKITSMASNVQWIFYKNSGDDILVKVLLNEREVKIPIDNAKTAPYYKWNDVKAAYNQILN